jgi:putative ABC transport system permease protein
MALGAQRKVILKLILGESMFYTLAGVIIGLAGAFALTRLLSSLLFGISPTDTTIFIGASTLVTLVSLLAIYVPMRKAMNVDPMAALRHD